MFVCVVCVCVCVCVRVHVVYVVCVWCVWCVCGVCMRVWMHLTNIIIVSTIIESNIDTTYMTDETQ